MLGSRAPGWSLRIAQQALIYEIKKNKPAWLCFPTAAAGITAKETQPHWGRHKNAASGGAAKEVLSSKGKINEWKVQQRNPFFVQYCAVR